ncbi:MAG: phage tail tip lysozyme [Pseudomonadota bacterium]
MALFACGDRLRFGRFEPGSSGCLVRFADFPDRVLMLAAGHVLLPPFAQQGDAITTGEGDDIIGRLFTWTSIDGDPTTDAVLIWIDPAKVTPELKGLRAPTGINLAPARGDVIRIVPHAGQQAAREARIEAVDADIDVLVAGPGWPTTPTITYRSQIRTDRLISEGGDSGAVALDAQGRAVGMVVAGSAGTGTVITPMAAILANPAWGGRQLELVDRIGHGVVGPPLPSTVPMPQALDLSSLTLAQRSVAEQVIALLGQGGFGVIQQAAALGNALAESGLNPRARALTDKEDSVGLFQLNRRGGEGTGRSVEELERIDVQCAVVLDRLRPRSEFMNTESLDVAVDVFVRKFERPADPDGQVPKRLALARRLLPV